MSHDIKGSISTRARLHKSSKGLKVDDDSAVAATATLAPESPLLSGILHFCEPAGSYNESNIVLIPLATYTRASLTTCYSEDYTMYGVHVLRSSHISALSMKVKLINGRLDGYCSRSLL